jgi:hypothetical protein
MSGEGFHREQRDETDHCHATVDFFSIVGEASLLTVSDIHLRFDREVIFSAVVVEDNSGFHDSRLLKLVFIDFAYVNKDNSIFGKMQQFFTKK